jgi:membrane protease YdiL (CAAX protease family)
MGLGCVFQFCALALSVWAIVAYFLHLRHSWRTRRLAFVYLGAALPAAIYTLTMVLAGPMAQGQGIPNIDSRARPFVLVGMIIGGLAGLLWSAAQGMAMTAVGARLSAQLRQPHFPLLRGLNRASRRRIPRLWRFPLLPVLLASAAFIGYSALLLWLVPSRMSPLLQKSLSNLEGIILSTDSVLATAILVSLIAVTEEIVFRLFLQTQLERWLRRTTHPACWAVLITSTLWTLGHASSLDPMWVKFAQIFPMGLALGFMRRRWGMEACISTHVALNIGAVYLLQNLVQT